MAGASVESRDAEVFDFVDAESAGEVYAADADLASGGVAEVAARTGADEHTAGVGVDDELVPDVVAVFVYDLEFEARVETGFGDDDFGGRCRFGRCYRGGWRRIRW